MSTLHVVFKVGEGEYVLPAQDVVQMESYAGATRVPGTAPYVAGLVQIRGRVVPVVDLRVRFGLPAVEPELNSRIVVVRQGERHVGLLADSAREVVKIERDQFRPPPDLVAEQAAGFVNAVAQAGKRVLLQLDIDKVVGSDSLPQEDRHGAHDN